MIEFKGIFEPNDCVRAQYLHCRPRPLYKVLGVVVLALAFWAAWLMLTSDDFGIFEVAYFLAIGYFILNYTVILPWSARRMYRQQKALQREMHFRFDDSGASASSEIGNSDIPWGDYLKWKKNDHMILLYISDRMYQMLPRRMFANPGDFDRLGELLTDRIGKEQR